MGFLKKTYEIKEFFTPTPNMELLVRLGQCYDSHWYYNVSNLRPDENSSRDQNVTQVLCTTPIHTFFFIHFLSLSSTWTKWYVFIFSLSVFLLTIPGLGGTPTSLPNSVACQALILLLKPPTRLPFLIPKKVWFSFETFYAGSSQCYFRTFVPRQLPIPP